MDKQDIHLFDITRILQGEVPLEFYVELLIRAVAVYLILIASFRLMGKRMSSRMTRNELAAVATLAAAIGIPLQTPDKGLIPGFLIAGLVILVQRFVASRAAKNERFERATQGKISTLVKDATLQLDAVKDCHMSRERVFSQLRSSNIRHLGEVQRLYLEANGSFTVINQAQPSSGLCILPQTDHDFIAEQPVDQEKEVCSYCGFEQTEVMEVHCPNCHQQEWVKAIK
jgi:uncharacterized membrane protein YcaP (DUF421 family)